MNTPTHDQGGESTPDASLWTYAYELRPPHAVRRMKAIRALLQEANGGATKEDRKWTARLVLENQVTHLLIVSDTPERDRDINRRIEGALKELDVRYSVTPPMPVG